MRKVERLRGGRPPQASQVDLRGDVDSVLSAKFLHGNFPIVQPFCELENRLLRAELARGGKIPAARREGSSPSRRDRSPTGRAKE